MQKWMYRLETIKLRADKRFESMKDMIAWGEDGWEVVAVVPEESSLIGEGFVTQTYSAVCILKKPRT